MDDLVARHPRFRGNWEDLRQFEALCSTPVRSEAREHALHTWQQYKLKRQTASASGRPLKKGAYIRALVKRAIDLSGAELDGICVGYADLRGATLDDCSLRGAWLKGANLENASLRGADLTREPGGARSGRLLHAFMHSADLTGAKCAGVDFSYAALNQATLANADLSGADLRHVSLVRTNVEGCNLQNSRVYGVAAWDLEGTPANQEDLAIMADERGAAMVTTDNLELAQFINLLMRKERIREVIETIGQRGVLILGRFTPERKEVLEMLRRELRKRDYLPMLFDFERPKQLNLTETVKVLAGLSRFVVADITNPRSSPLELQAVMPDFMIPFVPLLQEGEDPFAMFQDLLTKNRPWTLDILKYQSSADLAGALQSLIIDPALQLGDQLLEQKRQPLKFRSTLQT